MCRTSPSRYWPVTFGIGPDNAVLSAAEHFGSGPVIVLSGDVPLITADAIAGLIAAHDEAGAAATMMTLVLEDAGNLGRVIRDKKGNVERVEEVKGVDDPEILAVNEANAYRNRVINEAKGDAARIVQAAQAYREQVVREAQGEAERFISIEAEYKRAPAVTRQRLYTETMERILRNSNKVVIDTPRGGTAPIVLPPDLLRSRSATPPATPAPAQPPAQESTQEQSR